jgi:hypothetical protein
MRAGDFGLASVVGKRVGIVAERRDLDVMFRAKRADVVGLAFRKTGHIDVARAAVGPVFLGAWPAHDFDALVTFAASEGEYVFEREVTKDCADKT